MEEEGKGKTIEADEALENINLIYLCNHVCCFRITAALFHS